MTATLKCWMYWAKLSEATAVRHMKVKLAATLTGRIHGITNKKTKCKTKTLNNHVLQSTFSPEYIRQAYHIFGSYRNPIRGFIQYLLNISAFLSLNLEILRIRGHREETSPKC